MANCNAVTNSISNPPTPARRNRNNNINNNNNNNNNRIETATPPPLPIAAVIATSSTSTTTTTTTSSEEEKKPNNEIRRNHTISPPLPHAEPTTSSNAIETSSSSSPNRNNSQSPPLPMASKQQHISRKQQQQPRPQQPPFNVKPQVQTPQECIVCNDISLMVTFEPCYHQICCEDCGMRMKKCLQCQTVIDKRIAMNGKVLFHKETQRQPSADRLRYLESKILEIEETHSCGICMERRRNVAFLCGHSACSKCAETLKTCHM